MRADEGAGADGGGGGVEVAHLGGLGRVMVQGKGGDQTIWRGDGEEMMDRQFFGFVYVKLGVICEFGIPSFREEILFEV